VGRPDGITATAAKLLDVVVGEACRRRPPCKSSSSSSNSKPCPPCRQVKVEHGQTAVTMDVASGSVGWALAVIMGLGYAALIVGHFTGRLLIRLVKPGNSSSSNNNNGNSSNDAERGQDEADPEPVVTLPVTPASAAPPPRAPKARLGWAKRAAEAVNFEGDVDAVTAMEVDE